MLLRLAILAALPLAAQTPDFSAVEKSASAELARLHIPGASIAVVRGDAVIYSKGFGKANIENGEEVRPEMLFRLGSTTKMFTAAALVGLAVEGKIDLNAPVGNVLKFLPPKLSRVTADQLLSHQSGLRDEAPMYGSHDDAALGTGIRAWTDEWLFTSPGKIFSYSNPGYWLAGYLVETLSSAPYADAMESRLFKPLGMSRTTLRPTMAMTFPLAQGHEYANGSFSIPRPAADNAASWPAGSIFSNTHDLAQFVIAFMNGGRVDGKQVLDPKTIALMSAPHAKIPGGSVAYCYGLEASDVRGVHMLQHSGSRMGYGSEIRMYPAQRVAVIVQTNRTGATLPATAATAAELLVPFGPAPAESSATSTIPASEAAAMAGTYRNGGQSMTISVRESHVFLTRGQSPEVELKKKGDLFIAGNATLATVAGPGGEIEYLHSGARSFARVR